MAVHLVQQQINVRGHAQLISGLCSFSFVKFPDRKGDQKRNGGDGCSCREVIGFNEMRLSRTPAAMLDPCPGFWVLGPKTGCSPELLAAWQELTKVLVICSLCVKVAAKQRAQPEAPQNYPLKIKVPL